MRNVSEPPSATTTAPPPNNQSTSITNAGRITGAGSQNASAAAQTALYNSDFFSAVSQFEQAWERDLYQRVSRLQTQAEAAQASSPKAQEKFLDSLSQSFNPPNYLSEAYAEHNLRTKEDLLERGPDFLDNLSRAEKHSQKVSSDWLKSAEEAFAAAGELSKISETLSARAEKLRSLEADKELPSTQAGAVTGGEEKAPEKPSARASALAAEGTPASSKEGKITPGDERRSSANKAVQKSAEAESGSGAKGEAGEKESGGKAGLRERLAALLKRKPADPFESKDLTPPPFSHAARDGKESPLSELVSGVLHGRAAAKSAEGKPPFTMSASETEAEVRSLVDSIEEKGGRAPASGSYLGREDITLFQRVTLNLRKCQKENCIRWR